MPSFIDQYITEIAGKRSRFANCFSTEPRDDAEKSLAAALKARWRPLPAGPQPADRQTFAVDGASGSRPLENGATLLVAQSLVLGPDTQESMVMVELVRGGEARNAERVLDHMRQWCEAEIALRHIDRMRGGMLLIDGSVLADLAHILAMGPMRVAGGTDLRARLVESFVGLIEGCRDGDVLLAGLAKTTKDGLLHQNLVDDPGPAARLGDMEVLYRFGGGRPGYTEPMLFGTQAIQVSWDKCAPGMRCRAEALPCVAVSFVRLAGGEDPLRVDVLGCGIGQTKTLLGFGSDWSAGSSMEPLILRLMAQHGGANVYNGPLYGVDRLVRLSGTMMDGACMSLLREATGVPVNADRGTRRFTRSG